MRHDAILIVDYGSQYTQLIARRIRELGVYALLTDEKRLPEQDWTRVRGIILSGGPQSVTDHDHVLAETLFSKSLPILGICYGMQLMAKVHGGAIEKSAHSEYGQGTCRVVKESALLAGIPSLPFSVWMSHGDSVTALPEGFESIASTEDCPHAAMSCEAKRLYACQFHPEVTHSDHGRQLLQNFVLDICAAVPDWTSENIGQEMIRDIRQQVGEDHVILAVSGGVDSTVLATLLHEAIGERLLAVFVDTGLMRLRETEEVQALFTSHGIEIEVVQAQEAFFSALEGIDEPEAKRKAIGRTFIEIFEKVAAEHPDIKWLAQGTIYPDVIESSGIGKSSHVIKSHHNVGGLPERLALNLLEPLRQLFKDEVRELGRHIGLPESWLMRHPFPGPGLGVRILGEIKREYVEICQQADAIFIETLRAHGYYAKVSQAFAVFLPVKSVGVMGDARRYDYVITLRAVTSEDFMTARWANLPAELLTEAAHRIVNEVEGVARVTYDITHKPPATIEWE